MNLSNANQSVTFLVIELNDDDFSQENISTQFKSRLDLVVESAQITKLLLDLKSVTFVSSSGIGQLILLKKKCDQNEIALALCNISPDIMKVLRLVRCDELIDLFDSKDAAIASLQKTIVPVAEESLSPEALQNLVAEVKSGNVNAIYELARRKLEGDGVEQNVTESASLFKLSAESDHGASQFALAQCYAFGFGVSQDYSMAMYWYKKAAEQNVADAQYMIGVSLQFGLVEENDQEAAKPWYEKAAAQGHVKASEVIREWNGQLGNYK